MQVGVVIFGCLVLGFFLGFTYPQLFSLNGGNSFEAGDVRPTVYKAVCVQTSPSSNEFQPLANGVRSLFRGLVLH